MDFQPNEMCAVCGKRPQIAYNVSHSHRRTKRMVRPNLQKMKGRLVCSVCRRTATKLGNLAHAA